MALEVSLEELAEVEQDFVGDPLDGGFRGGWQGCIHEVQAFLIFFALGSLTGMIGDEGELVEVDLY